MTAEQGPPAPQPLEVDCPVCGASNHADLHTATDRWMGGPGTFRYARCSDCGQIYLRLRPAPEAMSAYYPEHYIHRGRGPRWARRALRRMDLAPRVRISSAIAGAGGRVLDVGCAQGDYLTEVRRRGLVPVGLEPAGWASERARARGLPVWSATLDDVVLPDGAFDLVTMWDVLEHLPRPLEGLQKVARALRPEGHLIVSTPVLDGWDARLWGLRWPGWDTPRHLVVFERRTLQRLLEQAGFHIEEWTYLSEGWLISALAMTIEARDRLPRPVASAVRGFLHLRPLRWAMGPLFRWLDARFGGSAVSVVARRRTAP